MSDTLTSLASAIEDAIAQTFSEMAFVDAIPAEAPGSVEESQVFTIQIDGEASYRVVLRLSLASKKSIVENIHGKPWGELHSVEIDDCLLEFLNVLGGAFGKALWGDDSRYKLSFPAVEIGIPEDARSESAEEYWFDAEGAIFSVVIAPV
ncbi:MAG: hypothetical protein ACLFP4_08635 [Spirochaetales bacterium]